MVLDPIPQSLPVHFCGSRPQPPTSPPDVCLACGCFHACRCTMFLYYMYYVYFILSMCYSTHSTHIILHILYATIAILCVLCVLHIFYTSHSSMLHLLCIQPVAFGVSCNLNFQSQSPWSVFNGAWYKGPRALDHRLRFENGKKHTPNAIGCITCARFRASLHHVECVLLCCVCVCVCVLRLCVCVCVCV